MGGTFFVLTDKKDKGQYHHISSKGWSLVGVVIILGLIEGNSQWIIYLIILSAC